MDDKETQSAAVEPAVPAEKVQANVTPFGLRFLESPVWVGASMTRPTGVTGTPDNDYDDDPS